MENVVRMHCKPKNAPKPRMCQDLILKMQRDCLRSQKWYVYFRYLPHMKQVLCFHEPTLYSPCASRTSSCCTRPSSLLALMHKFPNPLPPPLIRIQDLIDVPCGSMLPIRMPKNISDIHPQNQNCCPIHLYKETISCWCVPIDAFSSSKLLSPFSATIENSVVDTHTK